MRISIFGMGYVGTVAAACLARDGHTVVGVEPNLNKVDLINAGRSPVSENGLERLLTDAVQGGKLTAVSNAVDAIDRTEMSLVCVGTPSLPDGSLDLSYVTTVCEQVGRAIKRKAGYHIIVVRSTMLPGSTRNTVIPLLEKHSGMNAGEGFGVCYNPEFLREGTAIADYDDPSKIVIGENDAHCGEAVSAIYQNLVAPTFRTSFESAEMAKYADNAWHALKVSFANEIGSICKELDVDGREVMNILCSDGRLNISTRYLRPAFAFGGPCLPKDLRALCRMSESLGLRTDLIHSIASSNHYQIERGLRIIEKKGNQRVSILGLSFKAGTDDLRESPVVELTARLMATGYDVRIYDKNVDLSRLTGANKDYILSRIPEISKHLVESMEDVLRHGGTIVIANDAGEFSPVLDQIEDSTSVVDLVGTIGHRKTGRGYEGICW